LNVPAAVIGDSVRRMAWILAVKKIFIILWTSTRHHYFGRVPDYEEKGGQVTLVNYVPDGPQYSIGTKADAKNASRMFPEKSTGSTFFTSTICCLWRKVERMTPRISNYCVLNVTARRERASKSRRIAKQDSLIWSISLIQDRTSACTRSPKKPAPGDACVSIENE